MTAEATITPVDQRGVFPIDSQLMFDRVDFSDELTQAEQIALQDGNLETLPDDSPTRYLLEGRARPDLPEKDRPEYSNGVLAAVSVLRMHLRELRSQGQVFSEPTIGSLPLPETEHLPRSSAVAWVGSIALYPFRHKLRQLGALQSAIGDAATYFDEDTHISVAGFLGSQLRISGLPFASDTQVQRDALLPFWQGVRDSLTLYHQLYEQEGLAGERSPVTYTLQDNASYTWRKDRRDTWRAAGLTEPAVFKGGPDYTLGTYHATGYRASMEINGQEERADLMWAYQVPAGATVEQVRTFSAQGILLADKSGALRTEEVVVRGSLQNVTLRPRDTLIVTGKDGQLFSVRHPFQIDPSIADEDGRVSLVRVCQFGEVTDLLDYRQLVAEEDLATLRLLTQQGIAGQRVPLFRAMGRRFLEEHAEDYAMSTSTASVVGPAIHDMLPDVPASYSLAGSFALLYGGLRLRRYLLRRRSSASTSSK
jgi:hypothetical protein